MAQFLLKRVKQNRNRKAQLFSTDVLVAFSLMSLMLTLVLLYWTIGSNEINLRQRRIDMQRAAFDASNYLTRILAVNATGELNSTRLKILGDCDYQAEKTNLGLGGFDYLLNFSYANSSQLIINNTTIACGLGFENSSDIMKTRRMAVYDGNEIIINLYVWK